MSLALTDFFLEMIILAHAVGWFIFGTVIHKQSSGYNISNFVFSIIFFLFPIHKICGECIKSKKVNS